MFKTITKISLTLLMILSLVSCSFLPTNEVLKNEIQETIDSTVTNESNSDETEPSDKELITGIELHTYPDPYRVKI